MPKRSAIVRVDQCVEPSSGSVFTRDPTRPRRRCLRAATTVRPRPGAITTDHRRCPPLRNDGATGAPSSASPPSDARSRRSPRRRRTSAAPWPGARFDVGTTTSATCRSERGTLLRCDDERWSRQHRAHAVTLSTVSYISDGPRLLSRCGSPPSLISRVHPWSVFPHSLPCTIRRAIAPSRQLCPCLSAMEAGPSRPPPSDSWSIGVEGAYLLHIIKAHLSGRAGGSAWTSAWRLPSACSSCLPRIGTSVAMPTSRSGYSVATGV